MTNTVRRKCLDCGTITQFKPAELVNRGCPAHCGNPACGSTCLDTLIRKTKRPCTRYGVRAERVGLI